MYPQGRHPVRRASSVLTTAYLSVNTDVDMVPDCADSLSNLPHKAFSILNAAHQIPIWTYYNAFKPHQNMHLVVNGCRWFACLEIFTQPHTNI